MAGRNVTPADLAAELARLQEDLADLRLKVKYLGFDNECLKRERDQAREEVYDLSEEIEDWQRICHEKNETIELLRRMNG